MSHDELLAEWRDCIWSAVLEAVQSGPQPEARPGPDGLTASQVISALGRRKAVPPQRSLVDALTLPEVFVPSFRVTVPIRNRQEELFGLDFQVTKPRGLWNARLLRVLRVDEAAFADCYARAEGVASERMRERIDPPVLPAEPRRAGPTNAASIRLAPVEAAAVCSRVAGVPFAPAEFEWPRRASGRALAFLAQVDLRELPSGAARAALPADGTVAFFYDAELQPTGLDDDDQDGGRALYWPASEALAVAQPPEDLDPVQLAPQRGLAASDDGAVMRMLGEPDAVQDDPRAGGDWLLLMQFDSGDPLGIDFYDAGRLYFLIAPQALAEGRFDQVRLDLQSY